MFEDTVFAAFKRWKLTPAMLYKLEVVLSEKIPYIINFTPRSGSSFLADCLTRSKLAGVPDEYLNPDFVPGMIDILRKRGRSVDRFIEYMMWMLQMRSTKNGVVGVKVSYFQFKPFIDTGLDRLFFGRFKPFLLSRRNIIKQAVSLYIATETQLFHTNVDNPVERIEAARHLEYNQTRIRYWVEHVWLQEIGWNKYFQRNVVKPAVIEYDDLMRAPAMVVGHILEQLGVLPDDMPNVAESAFKIVRTERNTELASIFLSDDANREYLSSMGISEDRFEGE